MIILPAIDIMGGKVVRLCKGDYQSAKSYPLSCVKAAKSFVADGATHIHAVDLDGAKSGNADNAVTVKNIIDAVSAFVEIGGGIRTEEQIEKYLDVGASRVILGTAAVKNFNFVKAITAKYPGKIAVGVDAVNGNAAISGWREITDVNSIEFCKKLADAGIENVIYTDISRDGTLCGTNLEIYEKLVKISGLKITASGGISDISEIKILKEIGVYAAVLGKALYENRLSLAEAVKAAR